MNPFCPSHQSATEPRGTGNSRISRIKVMRLLWQTLVDARADGFFSRRDGGAVCLLRIHGGPIHDAGASGRAEEGEALWLGNPPRSLRSRRDLPAGYRRDYDPCVGFGSSRVRRRNVVGLPSKTARGPHRSDFSRVNNTPGVSVSARFI